MHPVDPVRLAKLTRATWSDPHLLADATVRVATITDHHPAAVTAFTLSVLQASAPAGNAGCRWCLARSYAKVNNEQPPYGIPWREARETPAWGLALHKLLGMPCRACARGLPTSARGIAEPHNPSRRAAA